MVDVPGVRVGDAARLQLGDAEPERGRELPHRRRRRVHERRGIHGVEDTPVQLGSMTARTTPQTLLREAFPERPALDMAVSHALLLRVAEGARPAAVRIYEPGPTVAFSKLDTHAPGFAAACDAARPTATSP